MGKILTFTFKNVIFFIMLFGLLLRLYGIQHGYPYSFYPDESHFVKRALSFGSFDFNPHWFHKPAFYMYVLFFEYGIYFVFGKIMGLWVTTSDFAVSYVRNPGPFYLIGRVSTVFFSVGSIWIVYEIGKRHFKKGVGLIAALFLSLSFGHIAASQDVKADTPSMFFTILSMLFLLNYVQKGERKFLLCATISAGIGMATKTYSIAMLPPIMMGVFIVHQEKVSEFKDLILKLAIEGFYVVGIFYFVFFICSPYHFLDPLGRQATFGNILRLGRKIFELLGAEKITKPGDFIIERSSFVGSTINYLRVLFATEGMGTVIATICSFGVLSTAYSLNKQRLLLVIYPLLFGGISIFIGQGYVETRHQIPIYPFLAVFGGIFCLSMIENKRIHKTIFLGLLSLFLIVPLYKVIERGASISMPDTRNVAKAWIESNVPLGVKVLLDENGIQLLSDEISLKRNIQKASLADSGGQFTAHYDTYLKYQLLAAENAVAYDIQYIRFPWWRAEFKEELQTELTSEYDKDMANPLRPVGVDTYERYVENGFQYVVVQSEKYQNFINEHSKNKEKFPSFARFYTTLFEKGVLVKEFSSAGGDLFGPTVKIFKIDGIRG